MEEEAIGFRNKAFSTAAAVAAAASASFSSLVFRRKLGSPCHNSSPSDIQSVSSMVVVMESESESSVSEEKEEEEEEEVDVVVDVDVDEEGPAATAIVADKRPR